MRIKKNYNSTYAKNIIWVILFLVGFISVSFAQDKSMIQIKTVDQQLKAFTNLSVSFDGKVYFTTDGKGHAFAEVDKTNLPPKAILIKNTNFEAESWNYSKGVLEVVVREKNHREITVKVRDQRNSPVKLLKVNVKTPELIVATTNNEGEFKVSIAKAMDPNKSNIFSIKGYEIKKQNFNGFACTLHIDPIISSTKKPDIPPKNINTEEHSGIQPLDTITSLNMFYALIKRLEMPKLDDTTKIKFDSKYYQLVGQMKDSLSQSISERNFVEISDSSLVREDISYLINKALEEKKMLEAESVAFDYSISLISKKLKEGDKDLTDEERQTLLANLERLEQILMENEKKFFQNQENYNVILGAMKNALLDIKVLEDQLTHSERQRLKEKEDFRRKIFIVLSVVVGLGLLTLLSIYLARKFKKQKNALAKANAKVQSINQHLEELVSQKTASLEKANQELDTFLYKSSHDLKRPLTSIIGLSNIAKLTLPSASWELFEKVSLTASNMDKMLQKLMMVNEINHPSNYKTIDFNEITGKISGQFEEYIKANNITINVAIDRQGTFDSYPYLVEIILRNLIENALFYSVLGTKKRPQVDVTINGDHSHVTINVRDNGDGINAAAQAKVWEMFYIGNERSDGNGLGLFIARKAAKVLAGEISFDTEEGKFTEFKVVLPVNDHSIDN